jgi:hypothetical protein
MFDEVEVKPRDEAEAELAQTESTPDSESSDEQTN